MKNAKKTRTTDEILMGSSRKRRAFEVFNYLLLTFMGVIYMIQRFIPKLSCLNKDFQLVLDLILTNIFM